MKPAKKPPAPGDPGTADRLRRYLAVLTGVLAEAEATAADGSPISMGAATDWTIATARAAHAAGNKLMFIGNGGSAAIASHMANDFSKNGGMRSLAFNDGAFLTCLGNDYGYEHVFAKQVEFHARAGDLLVAISASGRSPNILNGVRAAAAAGCKVLTLSGFGADNPLRRMGEVNVYLPSKEYGFVESGHLTLLGGILDLAMGWGASRQ
ncbi:MAG: SIS domain-containing protein [Proteobacteria bacterium]|nr:SIS domain-containing protein [Pseudomonadota bacterium]MBI3497179.1 SIS domain-containing protein [Pseudomonadota bacterium]